MNETPKPAPQTLAEIDAALDARPQLVEGLRSDSPQALLEYFELAGTTVESFTVRNIT